VGMLEGKVVSKHYRKLFKPETISFYLPKGVG
jgi:hypothetical protein